MIQFLWYALSPSDIFMHKGALCKTTDLLVPCLLLFWGLFPKSSWTQNAVIRDMISQSKISVTTQFRFFVYPPLEAEFSQLETSSLDQNLGTLLSAQQIWCALYHGHLQQFWSCQAKAVGRIWKALVPTAALTRCLWRNQDDLYKDWLSSTIKLFLSWTVSILQAERIEKDSLPHTHSLWGLSHTKVLMMRTALGAVSSSASPPPSNCYDKIKSL